jgi:hypothetical protein
MGFLRTILLILLVYYLLKILGRWLAPKFFAYIARKAEKHVRETFGQYERQVTPDEEQIGNMKSRSTSAGKKKSSDKVGEYIDFEEID